jgi:OFA family oxalate/formate antiporter-like MFS transporter
MSNIKAGLPRNKWLNGALPAILIHGSIGSVYAWSLFVSPISALCGASAAAIQFAFSLAIFFLGMSAAFGGAIVERNIKVSSLISMLCFCGGLLLTALAIFLKCLPLIYLGYGVLMGIGLGIGYITPVKTLMLWFEKQKGLATGISVCAFGFASSIASPIITFLSGHLSLTMTFICLSALYAVPMLIAHFLLKKPEGWVEARAEENDFKVRSLLEPKFIGIWLIIFLNISCGLAVISTASLICTELSFKPALIATIISVMGIFNGAGRLVFSAISDKFKNRVNIYYVILGLSWLVGFLALSKNLIAVIIALALISACYGAGFSCLPSLLSDIYGMKNISKIHGISLTAWAIAGLCGNQMATMFAGITGSYLGIFKLVIVLYAIGVGIVEFVKEAF